MKIKEKKVRKFLSKQIQELNNIVADLDDLVTEIGTGYYRVAIFGSARTKPKTPEYKSVYNLAKELASRGADIVTGGGPGLMEAANAGAKEGSSQTKSFGLRIDLPFENDFNNHLDIKFFHKKFSSRLDEFMRITNAVVVTPGGIGTLLELFFAWQLIQVGHMKKKPIILVGTMWEGLLQWMKENPLRKELIDKSDLQHIQIVEEMEDVVPLLEKDIKSFYQLNGK